MSSSKCCTYSCNLSNEKLAQHERDYLEGERRDPPPTQLFGYDTKTDNESDFHCEELTIENENL